MLILYRLLEDKSIRKLYFCYFCLGKIASLWFENKIFYFYLYFFQFYISSLWEKIFCQTNSQELEPHVFISLCPLL